MKKIIFGLLIAFVALSFMGCPTVHEDAEFKVITPVYFTGDMNGWNWALTDAQKITWVLGTGVATASIEFTVTEEKDYGYNVCDADYNPKYGADLELGKDFIALKSLSGMDSGKIKQLTAGTYVFMLEADSSEVKAKVVKK